MSVENLWFMGFTFMFVHVQMLKRMGYSDVMSMASKYTSFVNDRLLTTVCFIGLQESLL